ncbi:MAG TPA: efflux RND transporter periplasmic adaptor subunit [Phycisphaerales bacterium]|nr:efflux RND transporter periplasmic adaptor subunit [Phycisphaerales bacterium]
MKRSAVIAAAVLFGVIFASGAALYIAKRIQIRRAEASKVPHEMPGFVEVVPARTVEFQPTADLTGTVFSRRTVRVQNEVSGYVKSVNFQSGDTVEAGQVLVVIDDSTDVADLHAAEASVRVKQAELKVVDARIRLADAEYKRQHEAHSVAATSAMEVDRAKAEVDKATADRLRSQAEIEEAQAKVEQMRVRLSKFTLKAPFKGRVGMRTVHEGQFLPPQMGMGGDEGSVAVIEEVADTIYLDFAIPQEYMPRVVIGMTVAGSSPLYGDEPLMLKVVAIDAAASRETRNVRVRSEVDNKAGRLRAGMSVQVRVPLGLPANYVAVPVTAIQRSSSGESLFAAVKDDKGVLRAQQRFVKLGPVIPDADPSNPASGWVAVTEGVKDGELIAGAGSFKLKAMPNMMVIPADPKRAMEPDTQPGKGAAAAATPAEGSGGGQEAKPAVAPIEKQPAETK